MDHDRRALRKHTAATAALASVPIAYLGIFFAWPVLRILGRGLVPDGSPDLSALGSVFTGATAGVIRFTIVQAILSTALTVAIGIPGAWALSRMRFPGRRLVRALVVVPFVLPTVVVGIAFRALLGDGGPFGDHGLVPSLAAILLAHVFFNYAVVVRVVGALWEHLDPHLEESARVLGAGRIRTFTSVTLPALAPAVWAAAAIVFLFTFTSFGVVLILGDAGLSTIETEIYRQTTVFLHLDTAAALTIVQLLAVVAMLMVTGRMQRRFVTAQPLRPAPGVARRPRGVRERLALGANLAVMTVLLGAPITALVLRSLRTPEGGFGLDSYRNLDEVRRGPVVLVEPLDAALTSVRFAALATVLAVIVGSLAAMAIARIRGRTGGLLDGAMALPLGISAVTVGFGFLIALDRPPLDLRTSWILVPIAQATVAIPLVIRTLLGRLRAIDPRLREAASVLGASPSRTWREVDLPIARGAVLVGAGFAFAMSLGEFGATVFVARRESTTLPVAIYRLLGQPGVGTFGVAMAASVLLMGITVVAILLTDTRRGAF